MSETGSTTDLPFGKKLRYSAEAAAFFAAVGLFSVVGLAAA
jgi:hypothetical protein